MKKGKEKAALVNGIDSASVSVLADEPVTVH